MSRNLTTRQARKMARQRKTHTGGSNGGRPRDPDRCPCGKFPLGRAAARNHKC